MNRRYGIGMGSAKNNTAQYYIQCRRLLKSKSLFVYMLQSVVCFLLLGPLLSSCFFQLWQYFWPQQQNINVAEQLLFGEVLLGYPIGFALSLAIDWHKAPLKSCLPLRRLRIYGQAFGSFVPNRTFFGQPGCESRIFAGRKRSWIFWFWLSLGLGAFVILGSNMLVLLLSYLFPDLATFQIDAIYQGFASYSNIQMFFLVVLSPVIFEELVYRGRGFSLLARYWRGRTAFVLTSLIFVFSHASPVEILSLLPLAFYLGWLRWRSGNLAFAMLVHLQNNGFAFLWHLWM